MKPLDGKTPKCGFTVVERACLLEQVEGTDEQLDIDLALCKRKAAFGPRAIARVASFETFGEAAQGERGQMVLDALLHHVLKRGVQEPRILKSETMSPRNGGRDRDEERHVVGGISGERGHCRVREEGVPRYRDEATIQTHESGDSTFITPSVRPIDQW